MFKSTKDIYELIYNFLKISKNEGFNTAINHDVLSKLTRNDRDDILEICLNNHFITGIELHKNDYGNYLCHIRESARITPTGIRFLELYDKYNKENIDILVLLNDSNNLIMHFKEKYDKSQKYKWIKDFLIFVGGILFTKLIDMYLPVIIELIQRSPK